MNSGEKYNQLILIKNTGKKKISCYVWLCLCDCGKYKEIVGYKVKNGDTKSCGCAKIKAGKNRATHGMYKSREYHIWQKIKKRCYVKNEINYGRYGGRGIKVCKRWLNSFENFLKDMGPMPSDLHSIERIDNDGDYDPSNCMWQTAQKQARNRRVRFDNKFGITGISYDKKKHKYAAQIDGLILNYYTDFFEACCVRKSAENKIWKYYD